MLVLIFCLLLKSLIKCDDVTIGGMFENNAEHARAFDFALEQINNNDDKLFDLIKAEDESADIQNTPFGLLKQTCNLLAKNALAIFGPSQIEAVQSVCDEKEIPHLIFRWNYYTLRTGTVLNFYPHSRVLSRAYWDIINAWNWKTFTILYDDNESLLRMEYLIRIAKANNVVVAIKQLDKGQTGNYRPAFKEVKRSQQKFLVIDCKIEHLKEILLQAQQIGLMNGEFNYFLSNLDTHTEDLTSFLYSEANITGINLVNPENEYVQRISSELYADDLMAPWKLRVESALLIDAVQMFTKAVQDFIGRGGDYLKLHPIDCNSTDSWEHGYSLVNIIKTSSYSGLTGLVRFDNEGYRSEFQLNIFELLEGGVAKVGTWNSTYGLNISRTVIPSFDHDENSLRNVSFIVTITLTDPYGMLKDTQEPLYGNDRYEGFGVDLIHELSLLEGFNYTFIVREDKSNGEQNEVTGKWSGMIGDLMEHTADLAITDLTITSERVEAVDFTSPFMNLGISILFRKPEKAPPSFFSFAEPFAVETWAMLGVAFAAVALSLYIMGRLCPDEWTNPYPCIEEPEFLVNQFSLKNSIWFVVGSLMQQGTEIAPIAVSTRMVAGSWWFFVLIIIASYTANLAAFLATENPIMLFKDVHSLVANMKQHEISLGAKKGGATANFFRDNRHIPTYNAIYEYMQANKDLMFLDNNDGVKMAEQKRYAFFMESTSIEYATQRHCDLTIYGNLLDNKNYGIAMRKNSTYRHKLSTAMLKLQSSGIINDLKRKWWEERHGGGQCEGDSEAQEATPLGIVNVEGVFYVTIVGTICSIILVLVEFLVMNYKESRRLNLTFGQMMRQEIKSYMNFESNVKPVQNEDHRASKSKSKSPKSGEGLMPNGREGGREGPPYGFIISPSLEQLTNNS